MDGPWSGNGHRYPSRETKVQRFRHLDWSIKMAMSASTCTKVGSTLRPWSQCWRTTVVKSTRPRSSFWILDNASCHKSAAFFERVEKWAERGLLVYYLPPYSPELNAIERLWQKLKYQYLPPTAWEKCQTLISTLTSKLTENGEVTYLPSMQRYAQ